MNIPEPYRGVSYSVSDNGDGTWRWKLHPPLGEEAISPLISVTVIGGQDEAIAAARKVIDISLRNSN